MRNKLYKILAAGFALALAFTLSCSSGSDEPPDGGGNPPVASNCTLNGETVNIGSQTWMKENLNCDVSGSVCYDKDPANCDKYGRLYDWVTAMALPSNCNSASCASQILAKHKGICPSGWHIPSNAEWSALLKFVDDQNGGNGYESCNDSGNNCSYRSETAAKYLKATSGWNDLTNGQSLNGLDLHGFSALPGGSYWEDEKEPLGVFYYIGYRGFWLSANEYDANRSFFLKTNADSYGLWDAYLDRYNKSSRYSVRCVKD